MKLDEDLIEAVVEGLKASMGRTTLVQQALGVSSELWDQWMSKGAKARSGRFRAFHDGVIQASAAGELQALAQIAVQARTDWKAARALLELCKPEVYAGAGSMTGIVMNGGQLQLVLPDNGRGGAVHEASARFVDVEVEVSDE